jgi:phage terminase small subunit
MVTNNREGIGTKARAAAPKQATRIGKAKRSSDSLTAGEARFVLEYLIDRNGSRAAVRAGYAVGSAKVTAHKLLNRDRVQLAIERVTDRIADDLKITVEQTLKNIALIAFYDIRKLFNTDGSVKRPHEFDEATAAAVASIIVGPQGVAKIRMHSKTAALDALSKYFGLYTKHNQQSVDAVAELLGQISNHGVGLPIQDHASS